MNGPHSQASRAKISEGVRRSLTNEEVLQRRAEARRREWQDPDIRRRRMIGMRAPRARCRFCGCTDAHACPPFGCSWTDASRTCCSLCRRVAAAWAFLPVTKRPNMTRAFARGFFTAIGDARGLENLYDSKESRRYWRRGWDAGRASLAGATS